MLGHASAAMTLDVYSGLFDAELDDVAERMDDAAGDLFRGVDYPSEHPGKVLA